MRTYYTDGHHLHAPLAEFEGGRLTPAVEVPRRADEILREIKRRDLGEIVTPQHFGFEPILRVHDPDFVRFLEVAHPRWEQKYGSESAAALPSSFPVRHLRALPTEDIDAQLGFYGFDTATPITPGTWTAARAAANVALSAAQGIFKGAHAAFALCRPPGHHAASDLYGGYCYLNNAAIAAQWLLDQGMRPAVLDVDYHHGNGTQSIFYGRSDVLFASVHADPNYAYPHFLGFADENGEGDGDGFNLNLPLPVGTEWSAYQPALRTALDKVRRFGADAVVVSLGVDTYEKDPISKFRLKRDDYLRMGEMLASLKRPCLFVMEGGYAVEDIGEITVNVLESFNGKAANG
jgi:acetoin utilization deacetylase AcuC-like enzyme